MVFQAGIENQLNDFNRLWRSGWLRMSRGDFNNCSLLLAKK